MKESVCEREKDGRQKRSQQSSPSVGSLLRRPQLRGTGLPPAFSWDGILSLLFQAREQEMVEVGQPDCLVLGLLCCVMPLVLAHSLLAVTTSICLMFFLTELS